MYTLYIIGFVSYRFDSLARTLISSRDEDSSILLNVGLVIVWVGYTVSNTLYDQWEPSFSFLCHGSTSCISISTPKHPTSTIHTLKRSRSKIDIDLGTLPCHLRDVYDSFNRPSLYVVFVVVTIQRASPMNPGPLTIRFASESDISSQKLCSIFLHHDHTLSKDLK